MKQDSDLVKALRYGDWDTEARWISVTALEEERDRYKKALEEILALRTCTEPRWIEEVEGIVRKALGEEQ